MEMTSYLPLARPQAQLEHQLHPFIKDGTGGTTGSAVDTSSGNNLSDEQLLQLFRS